MSAELSMTNSAGITSIVSLWLYVLSGLSVRAGGRLKQAAAIGLFACFILVTGAIIARGMAAGRFPVANLYESLLLFAWAILAAFLILVRTYRIASIGWIAALVVSTTFIYASWLPLDQREISPLMPALVSYWRAIHVPPLIISYGLILIAGLAAVVFLWLTEKRKTALACIFGLAVSAASIALGSFALADPAFVQVLFWAGSALALCLMALALRAEKSKGSENAGAALYDEISQRLITVAFPLLTFGIITGALWANHAWGSYWFWDPKETMSLVTWLSYALYLHLRAQGRCRQDLLAVLAVVGLLITLLTYLGFNFLGFGGLHSYGQIKE